MITASHVRELLEREDDATLVLTQGRAEVLSARELASAGEQGVLRVISGGELRERLGAGRSAPDDLNAVAATLDAIVTEQGG
ncbi:hypothetical protein P9869_13600 [Streptomyces ossamyceticus]|nr:hypothetical protein [Streptomyces ossamyceticus]